VAFVIIFIDLSPKSKKGDSNIITKRAISEEI